MAEDLQLQLPNYVGSAIQGYELAQNQQLRQAQLKHHEIQTEKLQSDIAHTQRVERQNAIINQLAQIATSNSPEAGEALNQLSAFSPEAAKGIRDNQIAKVERQGELALAFKKSSLEYKPKLYKNIRKTLELEGHDVSNLPDDYDPKLVDPMVDFAINSARDIEKVLDDPYRQAQIDYTKSQTAQNYADIANKKVETAIKQKEITGEPKLSGEASKTLALANGGLRNIDDLENLLQGKNFENLSGQSQFLPNVFRSKDAQKFSFIRKDLKESIGRLRSGGQITEAEEKDFLELVPEFGDKPETVQYKMQRLRQNFKGVSESLTGRKISENNQPKITTNKPLSELSTEELMALKNK